MQHCSWPNREDIRHSLGELFGSVENDSGRGSGGGFGGRLTEWFRDTDQCNLRCWLGPFGRREILGRVYHDGTCLGH